ncbi:MAG: carbohydrate ABC transporter permease [Firmicutes bacterium]|nr:carbohydrate ABC transporter permease [Bacillota bacterium]
MVRSKSWGSRIADAAIVGVLLFLALLTLAPLVHTIAESLSNGAKAAANEVGFWPKEFTWASYTTLLQGGGFFHAFWISVKIVILNGVLNFFLTILMAYPLSKTPQEFPARRIYIWVVVFTMLFNGGLIPWYITIAHLGIINTIWALVLPGAVQVFNVLILMNYFRSLPKELDEAARLDGAGPWYICWKIFVPLSLPALATVMLFDVVSQWNSFFNGFILINNPHNYPLMTFIQQLVTESQAANLSLLTPAQIAELSKTTGPSLNAAKFIIGMIPMLAIYPFIQRYFIRGIRLGSLNE